MAFDDHQTAEQAVFEKACICHDLAGVATISMDIDPDAQASVCCGPNAAYFEGTATLKQMASHIYGRLRLPLNIGRPHMFINELRLSIDWASLSTSSLKGSIERKVGFFSLL